MNHALPIFATNAPQYWTAGLPVFPVRGKRPAIFAWQGLSERMPTEQEQAAWVRDFADLNMGLACGATSGIVILDIDSDNPAIIALIESLVPVKSPWFKVGKKGKSYAFRYNGERTYQVKDQTGAVVFELLGPKRQTVLPPSIHPDTGLPYVANVDLLEVLNELPKLPPDFETTARKALGLGAVGGGGGGQFVAPVVNPGTGLIVDGRNSLAVRIRCNTFLDLSKELKRHPTEEEFAQESYRRFAAVAVVGGRYSWPEWCRECQGEYRRLSVQFAFAGVVPADLSTVTFDDALKLLKGGADALSVALGFVNKFNRRVPVMHSADNFIDLIGVAADLPEAFTNELRHRLDWIMDQRASRLSRLTSLTEDTKSRHNIRETLAMTPEDRKAGGVFVVKAPHAAGKTQLIGKPAAQECGGKFLAVCHRVSLTKELSRRLGVAHYQDKNLQGDGLAVCVNSIVVDKLNPWCSKVDTVFVDELSQVLRHVADGSVSEKARAEVFHRLVQLVRSARLVIAADADMNDMAVAFLEFCRPGERFTILETQKDHGNLSVDWDYGGGAVTGAMSLAMNNLSLGQRIIVATDSVKKARLLVELVRSELPDKKVLLIDADHKGNTEQAAFLSDPNGQTVGYDLVVHSPAISSGVSIEVEHFDMGVGLFFGTILPSDALQMMRRARRLTRWHVAFDQNNLRKSDTAESLLAGWVEAACGAQPTKFDELKAVVKEAQAVGTSDFAFGLLGLLGDLGYVTEKVVISAESDDEAKREVSEKAIADVVNAADLTELQARRLEGESVRTYDDEMALTKFHIRQSLGLVRVTALDVGFFDSGRGLRQLERFELATGFRQVEDRDHLELLRSNLSQRQFVAGKVGAYSKLFGVLDLLSDETITEAKATELVDQVMKQPQLMAALKVVPGSVVHSRPKSAMKFVGELFRLMGLELVSTRKRTGTGGRERVYSVSSKGLLLMLNYAQNRLRWSTSAVSYIQVEPDLDHPKLKPHHQFQAFSIGPIVASNSNGEVAFVHGNSQVGSFGSR